MASVRRSDLITSLAALLVSAAAALAAPPQRVVSINLCTDQLALLMAAPGQLISVTRLSHEDTDSVMSEKARALPANGSGAEEIYLLKPDLVLAGTFTSMATISMLRNLGIEVVQFAPARALSDVPERLTQMGEALGREGEAKALIDEFNAELAELSAAPAHRPRAALTYVNNYSSGRHSLAGDVLFAAGFDNVAEEVGLGSVGVLPLEQLVLLAPDVIIQGRNYPGAARAEDNLDHPALSSLKGTYMAGELTDRDWVCGTPAVLNAVRNMVDLRKQVEVRK
ncbi:ABC transporter substrate-binding protein [Sulfitobacter pseudonitzschiae]|uniref:ABC transporter substrate-binding protein n=1 Tax=Pseudosulfitobacter pseudonitzschiae TaxID=1402135 RepID=A0A9Q2NMH5_9RHOB|nr:ABC transporter substrate-binding protein [Pseudosulfitobacter pseudonitzschiae]MBM2292201.1 ABC transporter substrate-binding protein [Pseudosulfitobacter pseudonitzschiae]MBM2297119.1 ABC transporter substrate-binding protein [Pseudosulfitobacter pseudonitzschiae]MBM2302033.1 ABC transporter substrate-binding protein [Pseudosulfitobacter pseudonitzschiae]MBM2311815.1 ABC transporter substrate-binding protein [Pseudosulfitobacter pseudonitzschiae]MBM2316729.1 ABC transporter substrate-bind